MATTGTVLVTGATGNTGPGMDLGAHLTETSR